MKKIVLVSILFFSSIARTVEYLYPVGVLSDELGIIYLLHQKTLSHLELWKWNIHTKVAQKALISTFTPAGVQLLPDKSGFSFFHEGRVRIKYFNQRSPYTAALWEPLFDISSLHWIDNSRFYFSASHDQRYSIYESFQAQESKELINDCTHDCLYPQKMDDQLFYIERTSLGEYRIMVAPYVIDKSSTYTDCKRLIDFSHIPVAFLYMISSETGYCIEHPVSVSKTDNTVTFICHKLSKQFEDRWQKSALFEFRLPLSLIEGTTDTRLFESLLPLLPNYYDSEIEFCSSDAADRNEVGVYSYSLTREKTVRKTFFNETLTFSPIRCGSEIYFGGIVGSQSTGIQSWVNEEGQTCFELPTTKIKIYR